MIPTFIDEIMPYLGTLYKLTALFAPGKDQALDLSSACLQQLMRLWKKKPGEDILPQWIIQVAVDTCPKTMKQRMHLGTGDISDYEPALPSTPELHMLSRWMFQCEEALRLPFALNCLFGLSYKQVAQVLKLTEQGASACIRQALSHLPAELTGEGLQEMLSAFKILTAPYEMTLVLQQTVEQWEKDRKTRRWNCVKAAAAFVVLLGLGVGAWRWLEGISPVDGTTERASTSAPTPAVTAGSVDIDLKSPELSTPIIDINDTYYRIWKLAKKHDFLQTVNISAKDRDTEIIINSLVADKKQIILYYTLRLDPQKSADQVYFVPDVYTKQHSPIYSILYSSGRLYRSQVYPNVFKGYLVYNTPDSIKSISVNISQIDLFKNSGEMTSIHGSWSFEVDLSCPALDWEAKITSVNTVVDLEVVRLKSIQLTSYPTVALVTAEVEKIHCFEYIRGLNGKLYNPNGNTYANNTLQNIPDGTSFESMYFDDPEHIFLQMDEQLYRPESDKQIVVDIKNKKIIENNTDIPFTYLTDHIIERGRKRWQLQLKLPTSYAMSTPRLSYQVYDTHMQPVQSSLQGYLVVPDETSSKIANTSINGAVSENMALTIVLENVQQPPDSLIIKISNDEYRNTKPFEIQLK